MNSHLAPGTKAALAALLVLAGALFSWWMVVRADHNMRAALLEQTQNVAQMVDASQVQELAGTEADLASPAYQQLKDRLIAIGAANPNCKWIYLMGRKSDGTIFFLADSESRDVADATPPGEFYADAPEGYRRVFASRTAAVDGPVADRWGVWVSGLVPLIDPNTGALTAVLGMDIDASTWRWKVAAKAAPPIGLLLVLLIGVATVFVTTRRDRASRNPWPAASLLAAGLIVTAFAAYWEKSKAEMDVKREFNLVSREIQARIETRLDALAQILRSAAAFFVDDNGVTREEWREFANRQKIDRNLPGIEGIGFALFIPPGRLEDHTREIRAEGFPDYQVWPAGDRDPCSSIIFLEPFSGRNLRAFGHDMFSEPVSRAAMERASDQDAAALSAKVTLVQEDDQNVRAGVLMFVPVYRMGAPHQTVAERRAALLGWVYSPYRMDDLMEGILGRWDLWDSHRIRLKIFDGGASSPEALLYDSNPDAGQKPDGGLARQIPVDEGGHRWLLSFSRSGDAGTRADYSSAWLELGAGTIISLLLAGLVLSLQNTRFNARRIADRLTADLHRSEELVEHERLLLANLKTNIPEHVYIKDRESRFLWINDALARKMGCGPGQDPLGKTDFDFFEKKYAVDYFANEQRIIATGQPIMDMEDSACWPDGHTRWVSSTKVPLKNSKGEIIGLLGISSDITDRKAMEGSLHEALERAEAAGRAKAEFLSVMSHELRTPLNAVLGFAELLADTPLDDEQKDYARTIGSSGRHLLSVVNDILDFSSIESGNMKLESAAFATAGLVESAVLAVQKAAADKGLALRCDVASGVPDQIAGDERRICQILINLLGNAVKFTPAGSVVLRVAPAVDRGRRFLDFSVRDTGIGISSEALGNLFHRFTQADSTTSRRFGGAGLGLAISKRLAEAMGGSITVVSAPGSGSTFTLHLPLEGSPPKSGSDILPLDEKETGGWMPLPVGLPVLVVEDERNSCMLAGIMLRSLGCRAEFAANGAEALQTFVPGKFSAILMDIAMPVMDGLEATRKIREAEAATGLHVPIIAFTANVIPEDRESCLAAGMDDFLSKPFKREELAAKLARAARPTP